MMYHKNILLLFFCIFISFNAIASNQEGFLENTLIATPTGYQNIQDLCIGDTIYNENFQEKIITNTFHYFTNSYVQLTINDQIIECAPEQKLYAPLYNQWMQADQLTQKECHAIKVTPQTALIYCLTVQDHTYQVSKHNIIAHNSPAAVIAPSIILHFIQLSQPVLLLLGATVSLYYLSSYNPATEQNNTIVYQASPEKIYFDTRYQQLTKLKQEFLSIHAAVKSIKYQFQDLYHFLNYQQLHTNNYAQTFNITAQQEAELDLDRKSTRLNSSH